MTQFSEKNVGPYADVLMDRWFKRTFGWYPAKLLLTLFLKELIPEREIVDLSYGPQEHVNPINEGKDVRVDVECTDKDGTRFVVEMQIAEQGGFYNRAVFNSAFAIQQQIPRGERAFDYPLVYFIGVMDFSVHEGSDRVLYRYTIQETETHEQMTDSLHYLFLELPNYLVSNPTPRHLGIFFALSFGLKLGETCNMKWSAVDLEKSVLYVIEAPGQIRQIPIPTEIMPVLGSSSLREV